MNQKPPFDLLVFGDMCIDYFYETERIPKQRESSNLLNLKKFFGGMGANTAVAARMLGMNVGFFSVAGTDANDYVNYLRNLGISLYIKGIFGETTHSIFIKEKNSNESEKFISFFYKGVTEKVDELYKDVTKDMISNTRCVFMARTYFNLHKRVSSLSKNLKKFVIYNPGYGIFEMQKKNINVFEKILKNTDILILNDKEYEILTENLNFDVKKFIGKLKGIIITKNKYGATIILKDHIENIKSYETKAIDESGAGDAFNAGFIAAYLRNYSLIECVKIANVTASFVVEKFGCQTNLPTWDAVMERYKNFY